MLSSGTRHPYGSESCRVSLGDIVFCQSLTFSATANPIIYQMRHVFIDSDYETWNMSPVALKKAFEKYAGMGKSQKRL